MSSVVNQERKDDAKRQVPKKKKKAKGCYERSWFDCSIILLLAMTASNLTGIVHGQIGTTICGCSPASYTFRLRFDLTCPGNIVNDNGISNNDCVVDSLSLNNTDLVPVSVSSITIIELGMVLQPITQTQFESNNGFVNGSTIVYSSILESDPNLNEVNITGGIQAIIEGVNAQQNQIINSWVITFTNECNVFPTFSVGDAIGWLEIIDFSFPTNQYCPGKFEWPYYCSGDPWTTPTTALSHTDIRIYTIMYLLHIENPTPAPSTAPTENPTGTPSGHPTAHPSTIPTTSLAPSTVPSRNPTAHPSNIPTNTENPTGNPTGNPTAHPSNIPTTLLAPSTIATENPTGTPTGNPTAHPSNIPTNTENSTGTPTANPTAQPSIIPTSSPVLLTVPTENPTGTPTGNPTVQPSIIPTSSPVLSTVPTENPTLTPTGNPTVQPSIIPTTLLDSPKPTTKLTPKPTPKPTRKPTCDAGHPISCLEPSPKIIPSKPRAKKPTRSHKRDRISRPKGSHLPTKIPEDAKMRMRMEVKPTRSHKRDRISRPKGSFLHTKIPEDAKMHMRMEVKPTRSHKRDRISRPKGSFLHTKIPEDAKMRMEVKPTRSHKRDKISRPKGSFLPTKIPEDAKMRMEVKPTRSDMMDRISRAKGSLFPMKIPEAAKMRMEMKSNPSHKKVRKSSKLTLKRTVNRRPKPTSKLMKVKPTPKRRRRMKKSYFW